MNNNNNPNVAINEETSLLQEIKDGFKEINYKLNNRFEESCTKLEEGILYAKNIEIKVDEASKDLHKIGKDAKDAIRKLKFYLVCTCTCVIILLSAILTVLIYMAKKK
jgi:hypothetical protein